MSDVSQLPGEEQKSDFNTIWVAFDPQPGHPAIWTSAENCLRSGESIRGVASYETTRVHYAGRRSRGDMAYDIACAAGRCPRRRLSEQRFVGPQPSDSIHPWSFRTGLYG